MASTVEALAEEVRVQRDAVGSDVHPQLGVPWLKYGCALLREIEARVTGGRDSGGSDEILLADMDAPDVCERYEEIEDDLEVAWEALETARRCLEQQAPSFPLAQCHLRLADLLSLQGHKSMAVEECQKAIPYCQTDEEKAFVQTHLATLELLAKEPNSEADLPDTFGNEPEPGGFPGAMASSAAGEGAAEPMQVPVRKRKRATEEPAQE